MKSETALRSEAMKILIKNLGKLTLKDLFQV